MWEDFEMWKESFQKIDVWEKSFSKNSENINSSEKQWSEIIFITLDLLLEFYWRYIEISMTLMSWKIFCHLEIIKKIIWGERNARKEAIKWLSKQYLNGSECVNIIEN